MLTIIIVSSFFSVSFLAGFGVCRKLNSKAIRSYANPPKLETAYDVLAYLEASSINNPEIKKLCEAYRGMEQKQLSPSEPEWLHSTKYSPTPKEHWGQFFRDFEREEDEAQKVKVVEHWITGMNIFFTFHEYNLMLDQIKDPNNRQAIRNIIVEQKKRSEAKK